jgi:hypothetical protein
MSRPKLGRQAFKATMNPQVLAQLDMEAARCSTSRSAMLEAMVVAGLARRTRRPGPPAASTQATTPPTPSTRDAGCERGAHMPHG